MVEEPWQLKELRDAISTMGMTCEEALGAIAEMPSLGDDGIGEALVAIENKVEFIRLKMRNREQDG